LTPPAAFIRSFFPFHGQTAHNATLFVDVCGVPFRSAPVIVQLKKHNDLRSQVDDPCTAANMMQMTWDDGLAAASAAYAGKCVWEHDPANNANGWPVTFARFF
jgi:hypothetical protein